ncbi:CoA pyrophosphatase [Accumulibacter sp.]|uniref:CoA pyrophosphatase n=1 Tax=Accumulibacter sp. TaxID=2053492 RepID=UPI00391B96AF
MSSAAEALSGPPPAAASSAVDLDLLRQVLLAEPSPASFVLEDGVGDEELMPAAVLFPIVQRMGEPTVLLTQRTAHLKDHPGQISFPGGRCESADSSPAHTALRETAEEIGLSPANVEIVGYLPEYRTSTGFRVTPVVAMVTPPFDLCLDAFEVAEAFEVPLSFLMDPANHQQHSLHYRGKLRHYYAMPYGDYFIWGATAGIIMSLYRALEIASR